MLEAWKQIKAEKKRAKINPSSPKPQPQPQPHILILSQNQHQPDLDLYNKRPKKPEKEEKKEKQPISPFKLPQLFSKKLSRVVGESLVLFLVFNMSGGFSDSCCRGRAGEGFGLGVKLKSSESNPYSLHHHHHMMMVDHDQSRPFPSCGEDVYNVVAVPGFGVRTLQQPFDISASAATSHHHHHLSAFKSPAAGGMAASLGFPFTDAQWKELQRQAMIYKYMMASVPVPPDLFMPIARSLAISDSAAATSQSPLGGGFKLRFSGGTDPEPGRCRRTDGKKWRCSRDVAPDQKYCERHLHRGRPRSRKPVEHNANTTTTAKKAKISHHQSLTLPIPTPPLTADSSDPTTISSNYGSASQLPRCAAPRAYHELNHQQIMGDKSSEKAATLELVPRGLEWMVMKAGPSAPMGPMCPLNLNSHYTDHLSSCEDDEQWPGKNKNCISPSSLLTLSMNNNNNKSNVQDHEKIQMGLAVTTDSNQELYSNSWISSPLAEVLRPSSYNVGGNVSVEEASAVSSPSGVLQKTLVSLSDSSGSSSPTRLVSSGGRPEMALAMQWLNQRGN